VLIKAVYVYSKPEWTALVSRKDSGISRIEDLKDRSIAVTRGTDPHIFLLRALDTKGFTENDVNPVLLQHPDGYRALATRQVDAWAGLDPHMAKAQVETGAVLFYRNQSFHTYGILNVREAFAKRYPELVRRVLAVYERARTYAIAHPDELTAELVDAADVSPEVARIQLLERTDLSAPAIGSEHRATFTSTGEVLRRIGIIESSVDVRATLDGWVDESYLRSVG
jgi:sulfonate transport system substrate-binding protein